MDTRATNIIDSTGAQPIAVSTAEMNSKGPFAAHDSVTEYGLQGGYSGSPPKAIETTYRGYKFRSRLEARWAVFFDKIGIRWEYEPQGYVVDGVPYLPDFWLHGLNMWAEVKGALHRDDLKKLVAAAGERGLPCRPTEDERPDSRQPRTWGQPNGRILILSDIPDHDAIPMHSVLSYVAGGVFGSWAWLESFEIGFEMIHLGRTCILSGPFEGVSEGEALTERNAVRVTAHTSSFARTKPRKKIADAYRAARAARFEHGETS